MKKHDLDIHDAYAKTTVMQAKACAEARAPRENAAYRKAHGARASVRAGVFGPALPGKATSPPPLQETGRHHADCQTSRNPRWTARAASLFCPGLGQILEGRTLLGVLQLVLFLAAFSTGLTILIVQFIRAFRSAAALSEDPSAFLAGFEPNALVTVVVAVLVGLVVAVWSILDAGKQAGSNSSSESI